MSITTQEVGNVLTVTIRGVLSQPELVKLHSLCEATLRRNGPMCVLILAEEFAGWAKGGDWGDLSFQANDRLIEKMAIVADPKWKDLVLIFTGQGMRKFPITFFASTDTAQARAWLAAETTTPEA